MSLPSFLATAAAISVSGAFSPGPVTAVAIGHGSRDRNAGALVAVGHGLIEVPFVLVLVVGSGELLTSSTVRTGIALAGGACLLWMGLAMLGSARHPNLAGGPTRRAGGPISAGTLLSATNPYFYLWWVSVGVSLIVQARGFGAMGLSLFMLVHWLCDLVWLWLLSFLSFQGGEFFGKKFQTGAFIVCGLALAGFGVKFVADAARTIAAPAMP